MAVQFLEAALSIEPAYEAAFAYSVEVFGARDGDWAKVTEMAIARTENNGGGIRTLIHELTQSELFQTR